MTRRVALITAAGGTAIAATVRGTFSEQHAGLIAGSTLVTMDCLPGPPTLAPRPGAG